MIDRDAFRVALAQTGMAQWQLAKRLGYEPSTFSDYARGARRAPDGFARRVERALHLMEGELSLRGGK